MQLPLQITFHNLPRSDALEAAIRERAAKLEQVYERMIGCRVVVDAPHRNQQKGKAYEVRIDIRVPGSEIVITREPKPDCVVALNDAFEAARRRLKDFAKKRKVKEHAPPVVTPPAVLGDSRVHSLIPGAAPRLAPLACTPGPAQL